MREPFGVLNLIIAILVIVGGINWGLVGAFNFNLVQFLFGVGTVSNVVYVVVGLASLYQLVNLVSSLVNRQV